MADYSEFKYSLVNTKDVETASKSIPDNELIEACSNLYHIFADSTRLRILCALSSSELCVFELAACLEMEQSAISHQLSLLRQAVLVKRRREGKAIYYSLADDHVKTILAFAFEHIAERKNK